MAANVCEPKFVHLRFFSKQVPGEYECGMTLCELEWDESSVWWSLYV